MNLTLTKL